MRTEKDALGQLSVPNDVYYGIQSLRAANNFAISGTQVHPLMIASYLKLKKAAAKSNNETGNLDNKKTNAIVKAVDKLMKDGFSQHFIVDAYQAGAGTSQNMNVNEVVANVANEILGAKLGSYEFVNPNDDVNQSQSTNDTYPTAMRLATLTLSKGLKKELEVFAKIFAQKAKEFAGVKKSGRTHLQDAVPMFLGEAFAAYSTTIKELIHLLSEAENYLRVLGIGGSAVGNGVNVKKGYREFILKHLKKEFRDDQLALSPNMFSAMQSQLPLMIYSNALRAIALELTRIFNDLRLLSSGPNNGLAEIVLPTMQPGSSIMAGKVNPSMLEMGNQVCFKVLGNDVTVSFAMQAGQLELNVMMPVMAQAILESSEILTNSIRVIGEKCIAGISANVKRCEDYAHNTSQVATVLVPILGYAKVAELVKTALKLKIPVIKLIKDKKIMSSKELKYAGLL